MPNNTRRAAWADHARQEYLKAKDESSDELESDCGDLICDLLHLLAQNNLDPARALRCAATNFNAELLEEVTGDEGILDPDQYAFSSLAEPIAQAKKALEGDSNDAEHDALFNIVEAVDALGGAS